MKDFSDMLYLQIAQNYSQYRYLLTYLFGASPITEALFQTDTTNLPDYAVRSLRSSQLFGYANHDLVVSFESVRRVSRFIGTGN
ncbi:hypothetical protein QY886_05530 [Latilactobacillus sakei]